MHIELRASVPINQGFIEKLQQERKGISREAAVQLLAQRLEFAVADTLRYMDGVLAMSISTGSEVQP